MTPHPRPPPRPRPPGGLAALLSLIPFLASCVGFAPVPPPSSPPGAAPAVFVWEGPGRRACLSGSFNGWSPEALCAPVRDGRAAFEVGLPRGRHLYHFVVDGRAVPDPLAVLAEEDGFGGRESVLVVE